MKKRIFLTPLAFLGLLCLLVMTPTIWASNGNSSPATMDNNDAALTMMTTTVAPIKADNNSTTTSIDTGPADLLPVNEATLNEEENRLFFASTPGLPSQVDFNNLTAIENRVLSPGGQNPAVNNGDSKMKILAAGENFGQALEEKATVANDKTGKLVLTSTGQNFGTTNDDGRENTMLTESATALVVATFDGAQRAKIPKAAPSNHAGIGTTSIAN